MTAWMLLSRTSMCTGVLSSLEIEDRIPTTGQLSAGGVDQMPASGDEVLFGSPVDDNPDVLLDGTVSGGTPCKSIFEVLIAERLDTARAVLQACCSPRMLFGSDLPAQPPRPQDIHT